MAVSVPALTSVRVALTSTSPGLSSSGSDSDSQVASLTAENTIRCALRAISSSSVPALLYLQATMEPAARLTLHVALGLGCASMQGGVTIRPPAPPARPAARRASRGAGPPG